MGMKSPEEVNLNLQSLHEVVPIEIWSDAKDEGLIDPAVTIPRAA